ncbi:fimbrillin family protein [Sphingobacterium kitahiroshimense]|uniref:Fimbrillin family protein n=1 Tax=Sphingobacterium kitahiroshimense TaxID=470446 RepID=A0ABV0BVW3_9SPHI
MKKNIINSSLRAMGKLGIFAAAALMVVSCQKNDDKGGAGAQGPAKVTIKVGNTVFDDEVPIGHKSKSGNNNTQFDATGVQSNTVSYNDEFDIVTELTPVRKEPKEAGASASGSMGTRAAVEEDMGDGFKYRVAIFDEAGRYINHRNYERNYEGGAAPIMLDGGKRYTFVAYSLNNKQAVPEITFSDPANKTLSTATISVNGASDLMYFSKSMVVSGEEENALDITFKHLFSQITTTIDASQTGYNVTAVNSGISRHMPNASMALANGGITRSGSVTLSYETFSTLGTTIIKSDPTMINAVAGNIAQYRLLSLTVGPMVQTNLTPFTGLDLTPGVKYNLLLKIVPKDGYLPFKGQPAVRINGDIWMRHNLGVDTDLDPDALPMTSSRHGNYYQLGRKVVVGNGTSVDMTNPERSVIPNINAWNSGTLDAPLKGSEDPCPTGYRVPTKAEMERLVANTVSSTVGSRVESNTNYAGATVLTSKRIASTKMTIPAQGIYRVIGVPTPPFPITSISERGLNASLWTSYITSAHLNSRFMGNSSGGASVSTTSPENAHRAYQLNARPLRCIAE